MRDKIILAGGSGFLGRMMQRHFVGKGWEVVVLSRKPDRFHGSVRFVGWDGENIGAWRSELEGARAVVNLAGRSVDCRYHARNRKLIMDSRVRSTRTLGQAIAQCDEPPRVWLNSSTATIYQHSHEVAMDEWNGAIGSTLEAKDEFSVAVAQAWEKAFGECETPQTRKIALRTAMVLGVGKGGVYRVLRRLAQLGLGGRMGDGRQFVSWIHESDFCRAVEWLICDGAICGVVNLTAPNPVPNADMMSIFRDATAAPFGLPAGKWMLEVGAFLLRTETELVIKSRRVEPRRLEQNGFVFNHRHLTTAVEALEREWSQVPEVSALGKEAVA